MYLLVQSQQMICQLGQLQKKDKDECEGRVDDMKIDEEVEKERFS